MINGFNGLARQKEKLIRVTTNYDFVVGDFEIAPIVSFDFVDGETSTVVGIVFIRPF